jgi:uncharacterized damage-inducible protein DinB
MSRSLMADAFDHHVWATQRLIDACLELTPEQLETAVPGTYGSILETMRHFVEGDGDYLFFLTGDRPHGVDVGRMDLPKLRTTIERNATGWSNFLAKDPDAEAIVKEVDETDGFERDASVSLRLAQALHHGTDHRSQICTALTTIGVEPPQIDLWDFGLATGRTVEVFPP